MRQMVAAFFLCGVLAVAAHAREQTATRLVSLAPSLTELVFALDAGSLLVGVTEHCNYPPEARRVAKIGLYQTPSLEAVLALRPDWILALEEHASLFPAFEALGLKYRVFDHRSLDGLLASFVAIGELCGKAEKAAQLHDELFRALLPAAKIPGCSMLLIFGRTYGRGGVSDVYCAGKDGMYNRIIESVGCGNAYTGELAYPVLSAEGIAALNPGLVVELLPETPAAGTMGSELADEELLRDWRQLGKLPAVRDGRVHILRGDFSFVPGTRLLLLKNALAEFVGEIGPQAGETQ